MKSPPSARLGPVAIQILSYLSTHRAAQDTIEGITEWWLLEQQLRQVVRKVKQALAELVAERIILERRGRDGRVHYRLNRTKRVTIDKLVRKTAARKLLTKE